MAARIYVPGTYHHNNYLMSPLLELEYCGLLFLFQASWRGFRQVVVVVVVVAHVKALSSSSSSIENDDMGEDEGDADASSTKS